MRIWGREIDLKLKSKPSVFWLAFVLCILLFTLLSVLGIQYFQNKRISEGMQGVYITDINERSSIVSWVTSIPVKTELVYSENDLTFLSQFFNAKVGYDRRDLEEVGEFEYQLNKRGNYYVHSVLLRDLEPETKYYFAIKNGIFLSESTYLNSFSTSKTSENIETPEVAYGNIMNQENGIISDTLVLVQLTDKEDEYKSQEVSYVMDGTRGWSLDISNLLTENLQEIYEKKKDTYLNIHILNSKGETKKVIDFNFIKPVVNISTYDNLFEESEGSTVRGATTCADRSTKTATESGKICKYVCIENIWELISCSATMTCTGESKYETTTQICTRSCNTSTGSWSAYSCVNKTSTAECANNDSKAVSKNDGSCNYFCVSGKWVQTSCTCKGVSTTETATERCTRTCNTSTAVWSQYQCQSKSAPCQDMTTKIVTENSQSCNYVCIEQIWERVSCNPIAEEPTEEPGTGDVGSGVGSYTQSQCKRENGHYWCDCYGGTTGVSRCFAAMELYSKYNSSCPVYCSQSTQITSSQKTEYCGQGTLVNCTYGCEDRGQDQNDICKPAPTQTGQEIYCGKILSASPCINTDGLCTWVNNSCKAVGSMNTFQCEDIKYYSACNIVYGCEYRDGQCLPKKIQVGQEGEYDTSGYLETNPSQSEICTGMTVGKNAQGQPITASITQGTNMSDNQQVSSYHINKSSCAVDLGVTAGTPMWNGQITGYSLVGGKPTWEEGYSCSAGNGGGFGCYIDITAPNGQKVRYAHLQCPAGCGGAIMSGATGNSDPGGHLHIQVLAGDAEETNGCLGAYNPCNYIPGGCYSCSSMVAGVSIGEGDESSNLIKKEFNLISQVNAQEVWPEASTFVSDQDLQEGLYSVTYDSASRTKNFIKTDDNHIVFFSDDNNNGILDNEEKILSPYEASYKYDIQYSKIADSFKLVLQEGLNLVSFPILFKDTQEKEIKKASEIVEYLNIGGAQITSIATFRDGIFLVFANRNGQAYGDDFNILPGEGYFVVSHKEGVFLYSGLKIEKSLEINLNPGWNLVNLYNSEKTSYKAFGIIAQMKKQSLDPTTISKWEDGKYTSVVENGENQFGYDFNIYPTRGYFVRVEEKGGKFTPE